MNYGLYVSASAALTQMARQNVEANNLANVDTVGFKPDRFMIRQRDDARREDGLAHLDSNAMLERLGAGVMPMPTRVNVSAGALRETGDSFDLAIEGRGFFGVRYGDGSDSLRLTRDGRLSLNSDGTLVRSTDGSPVVDASGGPIRLDPSASFVVDGDGTIRQNGGAMARLMLVDAPADGLVKAGDNLLRFTGDAGALRPTVASVRQGFVESSGVNPIRSLMGVTSASRAAQGGLRMVGMFNEIMGSAINRLGRVN